VYVFFLFVSAALIGLLHFNHDSHHVQQGYLSRCGFVVSVSMYLCMYVCMYTWMHIYIRTYIHELPRIESFPFLQTQNTHKCTHTHRHPHTFADMTDFDRHLFRRQRVVQLAQVRRVNGRPAAAAAGHCPCLSLTFWRDGTLGTRALARH